MKLGFVSDSPGGLPLTVLLDHAVRLGVQGVEIISINANGNPLHPTDPAQGQG